MKKLVLVAVVIGSLTLTGFALAGALDQSSTGGPSRYDYLGQSAWVVGQTFTAGMTGHLDRVDLYMNREALAPDGPVTVEIQSASGNLPTGTILGSTTILATDIPYYTTNTGAWVTATFSLPATVAAGTQYALVLSSSATNFHAFQTWVDLANGYAGGQYSHRAAGSSGAFTPIPAYDLALKTYVAPLPRTLARGGYCASKPVLRSDGTMGTFLDLVDGQPVSDPVYAGAVRAWFGGGYGLTCDVLTGKGFRDAGYKVDSGGTRTGNPASDVYEFFLKP